MKYPSNPKTNLKDEYEALKKQRDEEIDWEKRMAEGAAAFVRFKDEGRYE